MSLIDNVLYFIVVFDTLVGVSSLYLFWIYVLRPKIKFAKNIPTLNDTGLQFVGDIHMFDGKTYSGTMQNLNISRVVDTFIDKITGALPKHDINALIKFSVEDAINKDIKEIITVALDKDVLRKALGEKINATLNEIMK